MSLAIIPIILLFESNKFAVIGNLTYLSIAKNGVE